MQVHAAAACHCTHACTEKARSRTLFPLKNPGKIRSPKSPERFAATAAESVTRAPRILLRVASTPPIQGRSLISKARHEAGCFFVSAFCAPP